jgi:hypothetical protein
MSNTLESTVVSRVHVAPKSLGPLSVRLARVRLMACVCDPFNVCGKCAEDRAVMVAHHVRVNSL